jgi:hypothetical protein
MADRGSPAVSLCSPIGGPYDPGPQALRREAIRLRLAIQMLKENFWYCLDEAAEDQILESILDAELRLRRLERMGY